MSPAACAPCWTPAGRSEQAGPAALPEVIPIDALPFVQSLRDGAAMDVLRFAHLGAACVLVGGVVLFDLRVLGLNRHLSLRMLASHLLPPALLATAVMVPTGLVMFITRATGLMSSGVFIAKMLLFALALVAVVFQLGPWRQVDAWPDDAPAPASARLLALASLLGWLAVVACGVLLRPR